MSHAWRNPCSALSIQQMGLKTEVLDVGFAQVGNSETKRIFLLGEVLVLHRTEWISLFTPYLTSETTWKDLCPALDMKALVCVGQDCSYIQPRFNY